MCEHNDSRHSSDRADPVEQGLAALTPRPARLDRDRLMFLAGQASAEAAARPGAALRSDPSRPCRGSGRAWLWPAATALSTLVAVVLGSLLALRPGPQVIRQIEYVDRLVPAPSEEVARDDTPMPDGPGEAPAPEFSFPPREAIAATSAQSNYLQLRDLVLAEGVDAWQVSRAQGAAVPSPPSTYRDMLKSLLEEQGPRRVEPDRQPFFDWTIFFDRGENL